MFRWILTQMAKIFQMRRNLYSATSGVLTFTTCSIGWEIWLFWIWITPRAPWLTNCTIWRIRLVIGTIGSNRKIRAKHRHALPLCESFGNWTKKHWILEINTITKQKCLLKKVFTFSQIIKRQRSTKPMCNRLKWQWANEFWKTLEILSKRLNLRFSHKVNWICCFQPIRGIQLRNMKGHFLIFSIFRLSNKRIVTQNSSSKIRTWHPKFCKVLTNIRSNSGMNPDPASM